MGCTKQRGGVGDQLKGVLLMMVLFTEDVLWCQGQDQRFILEVGVLTRPSRSSWRERAHLTETLYSKSAWGEQLGINITMIDTNIYSPFGLVDTVIATLDSTDVIIVSEALCDRWSVSSVFYSSSTPVICVTEDKATTTINRDIQTSTLPSDTALSRPIAQNGYSRVVQESSYSHLFSDLMLTEHDMDKMSSVLDKLGWSTLMVLYENSTEFVAKVIVSRLGKGVQTFLYNVEGKLNAAHLQEVLMSGYEEMPDHQRNILLLCSTDCAKRVIAQAEAFDDLNEGRTAMHYFCNWLIVSQSQHLCEKRNIQMSINNIAILELPNHYITAPVKDRVRNYLREVLDILGASNETMEVSGSFMRQQAVQLTIDVIRSRQQEVGRIMTMLWKQGGRELSVVADINKTNHIHVITDIFPNSKMGFNQKKFKIGTLPWYPYILRKTNDGKNSYVGYCIDLLEELAASLNFSYYWKEPDDGEWGRIVNDSWTGLVGQIQDKEVEMLVAPLGISSEREEIMDFIFPFIYDYTAVLFKTPDPNRNKWRQLVDPFKWQVLACIGVSLFSVGIIFWLIEKWNPFYTEVSSSGYLSSRKNFEDTILFVYGCLLTQGGSHTPRSSSGRMLIAFWWIFSIIVAATYSGNLIAFLTVNKDKPPFETLMDLTSQREYKWGTLGGSIWVHRFQTSNRTEFKGLWKGIEEFRVGDPDVLSLDQQVHLDKVDDGGYGFIADKSAMEISASSKCDLQFLKEVFYPIHYAIALPNNSPYFKLFSDEMLKVHESGLLQIWKRRWWPRQSMCKGSLLSEAKIIQLIDLQSAFYVIGLGVVAATCSVLVETFVTPRGRKRRQEKKALKT